MRSNPIKLTLGLALQGLGSATQASSNGSATQWIGTNWDHAVTSVDDTWRDGDGDGDVGLCVPFWTHHMRFNDDQDLIDSYNEFPAGIGLGKGRYNASSN